MHHSARGWDFGRFFYDLRAFNPRNAVIVNGRTLRGLPEPHQAAVRSVAKEEERRNQGIMAENGIRVVEPTEAMRREMADAGPAAALAEHYGDGVDCEQEARVRPRGLHPVAHCQTSRFSKPSAFASFGSVVVKVA